MHASGSEGAAPPGGEAPRPNPEAIAWYVEEAQRLLEDQQRSMESLRTRGGQLAAFGAAVLALVGGNAGQLIEAVKGPAQAVVYLSSQIYGGFKSDTCMRSIAPLRALR